MNGQTKPVPHGHRLTPRVKELLLAINQNTATYHAADFCRGAWLAPQITATFNGQTTVFTSRTITRARLFRWITLDPLALTKEGEAILAADELSNS